VNVITRLGTYKSGRHPFRGIKPLVSLDSNSAELAHLESSGSPENLSNGCAPRLDVPWSYDFCWIRSANRLPQGILMDVWQGLIWVNTALLHPMPEALFWTNQITAGEILHDVFFFKFIIFSYIPMNHPNIYPILCFFLLIFKIAFSKKPWHIAIQVSARYIWVGVSGHGCNPVTPQALTVNILITLW